MKLKFLGLGDRHHYVDKYVSYFIYRYIKSLTIEGIGYKNLPKLYYICG